MLFIFIFIEYCKWKIEVSRSNDGMELNLRNFDE